MLPSGRVVRDVKFIQSRFGSEVKNWRDEIEAMLVQAQKNAMGNGKNDRGQRLGSSDWVIIHRQTFYGVVKRYVKLKRY